MLTRSCNVVIIYLFAFIFVLAEHAHAGMTVITLTDVAEARLSSISFFVVIYLLLAWAVKGLWNCLAGAFEKMPRLSYKRALALLLVSGLFLYVILTMISGARELLTPGAWEKQGIGYELKGTGRKVSNEERRECMERLKQNLWDYAQEHQGTLPLSWFDESIPAAVWEAPGGGYYIYRPGHQPGVGKKVLAYDPSRMGAVRYVLFTDGSVEKLTVSELNKLIEKEALESE